MGLTAPTSRTFLQYTEMQKQKITDIDLTICANETIVCNLDTSAKSRVKLCLEGWSRNLQVGAGLLLLLFLFLLFFKREREREWELRHVGLVKYTVICCLLF